MDLPLLTNSTPAQKPWSNLVVNTVTAAKVTSAVSVTTSPLSLGGVTVLNMPGPNTLDAAQAVSTVVIIPAGYGSNVTMPLSADVDAYLENKTPDVQYAIKIVNRSTSSVPFNNIEQGAPQNMPGITGPAQFINGTIYMQRDIVTPGIYTALNQ